jgi:hypothetical protein
VVAAVVTTLLTLILVVAVVAAEQVVLAVMVQQVQQIQVAVADLVVSMAEPITQAPQADLVLLSLPT